MQQLDDDLWVVNWRPRLAGGAVLPARMTVVRLPSGGLWLHSACTIDDALAAQLAELGPVEHIVVPNLFHDIGGPKAAERYPDATLWAVPGWKAPEGRVVQELGDGAPEAWGSALDGVLVRGAPWVNEVVFHHRPSKTLVVTDLVFNVHEPLGCMVGSFFWLVGAKGRLALSRSWKFVFVRDKAAAREAVAAVLAWDFERVVMGHGDVIEERAKERLSAELAWFG